MYSESNQKLSFIVAANTEPGEKFTSKKKQRLKAWIPIINLPHENADWINSMHFMQTHIIIYFLRNYELHVHSARNQINQFKTK